MIRNQGDQTEKIFSLVYCPENGWSESFESAALLEEHVLAGSHKGSVEISSMDRVKQIFIDKMICSAQLHHPYVSSFVEKDNVSFSEVIQNIPLLGTFTNEGWALPVQKSFKYSYKQKKNLFDCFMQGETTGRKMTPKDVHSMIKAKLEPYEYVEEHQINALFSWWFKKYWEGTLQEPVAADSNNDHVPQEDHEDCDDCNNEEEQRSKLV